MQPNYKIELAPGRWVGFGERCFVIAEIGSNHNHDMDMAKQLITAAADAGADAVKFQTFRAQNHYSKKAPGFSYLNNSNTFELIKSLELNRDWHLPLKEFSENLGLIFLSSPCDEDAIIQLTDLGVHAFKVASFDLSDLELIRKIASAGRPVILSTGLANWMDIQRAVDACRQENNEKIIILQCTSLYPAPAYLSNLRAMHVMRDAFGVLTGYSDHTEGDHVCLAAVALGACIIEKHITLDRSLPGPDHKFAIEPAPLREMISRLRDVESSLGNGAKTGPRQEEQEMFDKGRRSLHAKIRIPKGTSITFEMLTTKRPGLGIDPSLLEILLGRVAQTDIEEDQWITWEMI
jgi:sialic acid synthase SpsE